MTERLVRFGYTEREAGFLRLAALVGGYFLRRHFNEYIGRECGALGQRLLERGTALSHLKAIPALGGRVVHHVSAIAVYEELGDRENRNRRDHQYESIRRRLMALDYVLSESGSRWLLTGKERSEPFIASAGVSTAVVDCLSDKQPVRVLCTGHTEFAFIDEGLRTFSKWELFLRSHRGLLQSLSTPEVIFASCRSDRLIPSVRLFRRIVLGEGIAGGLDTERLSRYFESRRLFEQKRFDTFDQARLDDFRECRRIFAGDDFERLYSQWISRSESPNLAVSPSRATLRTFVLPHAYEWLSPVRFQERRA